MKKIRLVDIIFSAAIAGHEVPALRGAIVDKVGRNQAIFHNHRGKTKLNYRYPLIQYKALQGKAALICVEEGVEEIHKYFENKCWDIEISGRWLQMAVDALKLYSFDLAVSEAMKTYSLKKWIPLNQENTAIYNDLRSTSDKIVLLEKILVGNILSFAKGVGWRIDEKIELQLLEVMDCRTVKRKGQALLGFDVVFEANVALPENIGLGKSVSVGYGNLKHIHDYPGRQNTLLINRSEFKTMNN